MHFNRSFWATIALAAFAEAAPSKLEARQDDRICRAVKEALGPQATPLCQSYLDLPATSTVTESVTITAVETNLRTTLPAAVTQLTAFNLSSTVTVVSQFTTRLPDATVTEFATVTAPQTTVYTYGPNRKRAIGPKVANGTAAWYVKRAHGTGAAVKGTAVYGKRAITGTAVYGKRPLKTGVVGTGSPFRYSKRALGTGVPGPLYPNGTAVVTPKVGPTGSPSDLEKELEELAEEDPHIAAFEERYGEILVSSACKCIFTPVLETVTSPAQVITRVTTAVVTGPAETDVVSTTLIVAVTRPVDITTTLGPLTTVTVSSTTTVSPSPVTSPAICNSNGLPSADAFNYDADFNTDQAACINACAADDRCFSTGFYIVTDPETGAETGTCRFYDKSVTDSADLGAGFYSFNDKACPVALNGTRYRGARGPRPYRLEY